MKDDDLVSDERAQFEKCMIEDVLVNPNMFLGFKDGMYQSNTIDLLWRGWKHRAALSSAPSKRKAQPIGYVRAKELEKLKDPIISGRGMMLHKQPVEDCVALYVAALHPAQQEKNYHDAIRAAISASQSTAEGEK